MTNKEQNGTAQTDFTLSENTREMKGGMKNMENKLKGNALSGRRNLQILALGGALLAGIFANKGCNGLIRAKDNAVKQYHKERESYQTFENMMDRDHDGVISLKEQCNGWEAMGYIVHPYESGRGSFKGSYSFPEPSNEDVARGIKYFKSLETSKPQN